MRTPPLVAGYGRWRDAGGKPGPRKGLAQGKMRIAPRMTEEDKRRRALAALAQKEEALMPDRYDALRKLFQDERTKEAQESACKPHLVSSREQDAAPEDAPEGAGEQASPVPAPAPARASTHQLTLVHDADALARDIANIGKLAIARIKETLSKPFNPADPNYQALLRFTSGVYNSTMNTMLKADENLLRARAVDRMPELLERIAIEERKRHARQLDIEPGPDGPVA
jgi:hypothetical protein